MAIVKLCRRHPVKVDLLFKRLSFKIEELYWKNYCWHLPDRLLFSMLFFKPTLYDIQLHGVGRLAEFICKWYGIV